MATAPILSRLSPRLCPQPVVSPEPKIQRATCTHTHWTVHLGGTWAPGKPHILLLLCSLPVCKPEASLVTRGPAYCLASRFPHMDTLLPHHPLLSLGTSTNYVSDLSTPTHFFTRIRAALLRGNPEPVAATVVPVNLNPTSPWQGSQAVGSSLNMGLSPGPVLGRTSKLPCCFCPGFQTCSVFAQESPPIFGQLKPPLALVLCMNSSYLAVSMLIFQGAPGQMNNFRSSGKFMQPFSVCKPGWFHGCLLQV